MLSLHSQHVNSAIQVPMHFKHLHLRTWALLYCCFCHCWGNMRSLVTLTSLFLLPESCIVATIATKWICICLVILWFVGVVVFQGIVLQPWADAVELLLLVRDQFYIFLVIKPYKLSDFTIGSSCLAIFVLGPWGVLVLVVFTTSLSRTLTGIVHTSTVPLANTTLISLIDVGSRSASIVFLLILATSVSTTTTTILSSIVCVALLEWLFVHTLDILLHDECLGN